MGVVTGQDRSLEKREVWREPLWGVGAAGPQEVGRWAAGCPVSLNPHVFPVDPRTAVGRGVRPSSLERRTSRHLALAGAGQGLSWVCPSSTTRSQAGSLPSVGLQSLHVTHGLAMIRRNNPVEKTNEAQNVAVTMVEIQP